MRAKYCILFLCFSILFCSFPFSLLGQRRMEVLDRGVVAMPKSSSRMYISWRHFATDPDDIVYNVYYSVPGSDSYTKLNSDPIASSTNYLAALNTADNTYTFTVRSVLNGVESDEPGSFTVPQNTVASRIVKDFDFEPLPAGHPNMRMKFCWPADLNGDGRYDFVMDRLNAGEMLEDGSDYPSSKVEAYTSEGKFLWRVDMGYNVAISTGHADMVTAYDMDGDGKAEVLMMVSEGTTFSDGKIVVGDDGSVTDYRNKEGASPQWLSIVNGETGVEIDRMELPFFDEMATTRTDSWKDITGHFIIAYLDGIRPSLIYQYKNRLADNSFQGSFAAWQFIDGKLELQWATRFHDEQEGSEFHQVRVADVDGDGYDEFVEGGYVIDHDGSLFGRNEGAGHGDRHTLADIDPARPGLEQFIIQQNNPNTLGMALYDVSTGEMIRGIYQQAVADVGRGICAAFDTTLRGLQFWSTMNSYAMYDRRGYLIDDTYGTFPAEPLWWGPNLSRYQVSGIGGGGYNLAFYRYNTSTRRMDRVTPNFYNENNGNGTYYFVAFGAGRPAFWGDILGDWREEMVCVRRNLTGFVVVSTWDETTHRLYSLIQNPAYRCQTTARGYYQTADADFYMAVDMPKPPVAPLQRADLYYTQNGWIDYDSNSGTYADGKSIMFDLRGGDGTVTLNDDMSPSRVWLMNPKGKDYTFTGSGKFTGTTDVVKSQQGNVTFDGSHDYTGTTRISEGRLLVNGTLESMVQLDARGVIGGNATLKGGIVLEIGLNTEGSRIEPGNGTTPGTLTITGDLEMPGRNNLVFDIGPETNDLLQIEGDLRITGNDHQIILNYATTPATGVLTLITYTGTTNATAENFSVSGMEGIPYTITIGDNTVKIEISESREAGSVVWMGTHSEVWDFRTENFLYEGEEDFFVPGDTVYFNDQAVNKSITIEETLPTGGLIFENDSDYTISGEGVISGEGGLTKTGTGLLSLQAGENIFTGVVNVDNSVLEIFSLKNGGLPSSIGASSADASNWIMRNATLRTTSQMATDRSMQLYGTLTVDNPSTTNSVLISGDILGTDASLRVTGVGTLTLQGTNTLDEVMVTEGLLLLGSVNANRYAMGDAKIILTGGIFRMFDINSMGNTGTFANDIEVPEGANARWDLPSRWIASSKVTGRGVLRVNAPYYRSDLTGDWSGFTGVVNFTGIDIRLNTAEARNMPDAEVNLGSGTTLYVAANGGGQSSYSYTFTFGALSGSGNISGRNRLIIGNKNTDTSYSGSISSGSGTLTKVGSGSLVLSGESAYTGGTTINSGKLVAANTIGSATGTSTVSVNESATLMGTGIISGSVTVNAGGTIMPGLSETSIGTLMIESDLVLESGSETVIKTDGSENDILAVSGSMELQGTLRLTNLGGEYTAGSNYTIFTSGGSVTGSFDQINPEIPGEGLMWDTTRISEGVISVVGNTK